MRPSAPRVRTFLLAAVFILVVAQAVAADAARSSTTRPGGFQTSRVFDLGAGPAARTFTLRERTGVILLNRITVPHGVRALVEATIPGLAGARVTSWLARNDPSLSCRLRGASEVCTQSEEWCPMPQATWHFRLVKLRGPAGPIRLDYVVATPPQQG